MANESAVARLTLDASTFDRQANASFREFSKQLTSVKDATDVAMRGAEALQKVFVKSLGGTIAIGAANALGDAMRDVGNRIGAASSAAEQAMSGISGVAGSMDEAAARGAALASSAASARKALEELSNAGPIQSGIFRLFGGNQVLQDLEESQQGLAGLELLTGLQQGNRGSRRLLEAGPAGRSEEERRARDEKDLRDLRGSAAFRGADATTQRKILQEFEQKKILETALLKQKDQEEAAALQKKIERENQAFFQKLETDRSLDEIQRARERERQQDEFRRGLDRAAAEAEAEAQDRAFRRADVAAASAAAQNANRGLQGARAAGATEILDRAAGLGGGLEQLVGRERGRQAMEMRRNDRLAFDRGVMASTSEFTAEGARRTLASRRREFIAQQAKTEARGSKSLTDVYQVLQDTLNKITSTPMVGIS